jgi:hypothetical protein
MLPDASIAFAARIFAHRAPQDDRRDGHATSIVAEVERLHWRIWNGKAKNAQRSIEPIW